ncbi:MAG: hypothetical protein B7C24_08520 [Bacteroidetes bacterium 4572_77]|nr:MAG: hypothetical protein B7C24_08520 [Bacteroidetes bacterium 4572_77]
MEQETSIFKTRVLVLINFISLMGLALVFEFAKKSHWSNALLVVEVLLILLFLVSFVFAFVKTGLWQFTHKSIGALDEREMELTSKSLRYAYGIFTIFLLGMLLLYALFSLPISIVFVVVFLIFAHLLPAMVLAWI